MTQEIRSQSLDVAQSGAGADTPSSTKSNESILTAAKGGSIVFAGNLFDNGCRFITGILLARLLGAEQLGMYNLTLTTATITANLALMGLRTAMVRYVSLYRSQQDPAKLWGTLQIGIGVTTFLSLLAGGSLYLWAGPIAVQLFDEPRLASLFQIASLIVPFLALNYILAAATRGFKKMQYTVISQNISLPLVRLILIGGLAITIGLTPTSALAVYGLTLLIVFVMLLYYLNKLFSLRRSLRTARRSFKEIFRFSLPLYLSGLVRTFRGNIQTALLGITSTITNVGVFAVASQINIIGRVFYGAIGVASAPIISELLDRGEREAIGHHYQTVTKWIFTVNLPVFLIVILFPVPILSIFGQSFVIGATPLIILAWANLVNTSTGIGSLIIDMSGNTSLKLVNSIIVSTITIATSIILIPIWGLTGAAVAALTTAVIGNSLPLLEVLYLFRLQPYNLSFGKPVIAGLVALATIWAIMHGLSFSETNLIYLAVNAIILLVVYGGTILLLGLSPEDRMILTHVRNRVNVIVQK